MRESSRLVFALALLASAGLAQAQDESQALAHDVYFSLNDASPAARAELVAACRKYLTGHDGVRHFSVGVVASELARPVNDRDFDVALHMLFASKAAHDKYQDAPRHKEFIAEQQKNWKKVRVFDSYVQVSR
jgi:hypothetical protein